MASLPTLPCYYEVEPPQIKVIFSLGQPQKSFVQYWPNIICTIEGPKNPDRTYILLKGKKGFIHAIQFVNGSLIGKKQYKIPSSVSTNITSMNATIIKSKNSDAVHYIFLGFEDGSLEIYNFIDEEGQQASMIKKLQIKPSILKPMPLINIIYWNNSLILCHTYEISQIVNIFDQKNYNTVNSKASEIKIKIKNKDWKLNIQLNSTQAELYIYNQFNGSQCYDIYSKSFLNQIQDCIRFLAVINKEYTKQNNPQKQPTVVIGTTDDSVKFIDYNLKIIEKFIGFKSYPSCYYLQSDNKNIPPVLWVGSLNGTIACFTVLKKQIQSKTPNPNFVIHEQKLRFQKKICENGIVNIILKNNILIIRDTQYNISFHDVIKISPDTDRTLSEDQRK